MFLQIPDTSDPGHFGTSLVSLNSPNRSALVPKCPKDSSDLSDELSCPKCPSVMPRYWRLRYATWAQEPSSCWDGRPFGHNRHGLISGGLLCRSGEGGTVRPYLTQYGPRPTSAWQQASWSSFLPSFLLCQRHHKRRFIALFTRHVAIQYIQHYKRHFYTAPQSPQCSHCKRCISYGNSVCLSVCLSHAGIVSKRRHAARCSLHCRIAKCAWFCINHKIFPRDDPFLLKFLLQVTYPLLKAANFDTFCLVAPQP